LFSQEATKGREDAASGARKEGEVARKAAAEAVALQVQAESALVEAREEQAGLNAQVAMMMVVVVGGNWWRWWRE
jgi:hypothetical protein